VAAVSDGYGLGMVMGSNAWGILDEKYTKNIYYSS
jgi:hypothetical protein